MRCIDCDYLKNNECTSFRRLSDSPLRRCVIAIQRKNIKNNWQGKMLEVGFGKDRNIRQIVRHTKCTWYGIDKKYEDRPDCNQYKADVASIPFDDNYFDYVCASQTIEHWKGISNGILEIYRVLKPNGILYADVPIYGHGNKYLVNGKVKKFLQYWGDSWSNIYTEEWRKEYTPLEPYQDTKRSDGLSSWILEIQSTK
jgi:ubiquinone/menaquinone biosynthesis C-methylase UbiE